MFIQKICCNSLFQVMFLGWLVLQTTVIFVVEVVRMNAMLVRNSLTITGKKQHLIVGAPQKGRQSGIETILTVVKLHNRVAAIPHCHVVMNFQFLSRRKFSASVKSVGIIVQPQGA